MKKLFVTSMMGCLSLLLCLGCETGDSLENEFEDEPTDKGTTNNLYQAEDFTAQNGCHVDTDKAGYTGAGFVDYGGNGAWIELNNVNAAQAGDHTLEFRYATASGSRQCAIYINGANVGNVAFSSTNAWTNWGTAKITKSLKSGNNTIRIVANTTSGGPNLDSMKVVSNITDNCPNDPNKTEPGKCGCGVPEGTCDQTTPQTPSAVGRIVYPWRSTTAIVKTGTSFPVWFNQGSGQTVVSVTLKSAYKTIRNNPMTKQSGSWVYDKLSGNKYNTLITVTVPDAVPEDRYDLVLETTTGTVTSAGAVKVLKAFKSEYYIVHMSDGHLNQSGYDSDVLWKRKSAMIDIANIIDAEIIIETGDNMYNVINHPEREGYYFVGNPSLGTKGMAKASAATFLVPGDHDGLRGNDFTQGTVQENSKFFNQYWGVQTSVFKYGDGRFVMLNNGWDCSKTGAGAH
ncbi:MAG: carbohydrate-binding protein, partial [Myxococcota bacterium]|nr:carbohydrate-binding protein [Myxococcota bacterium]